MNDRWIMILFGVNWILHIFYALQATLPFHQPTKYLDSLNIYYVYNKI